MGSSIIQQGDAIQTYVTKFLCDTLADKDKIERRHLLPGSSCLVIADNSRWILGNDKQWHKMNGGGGSSEGGDSGVDLMTRADVDAMFQ